MRLLSATVRRALVLACVLVWFGCSAARAAEPVLADLDGDGVRDEVTVDHAEPSVLHVWLSGTGSTATIRSTAPLVCVVARDLDGDHRSELIASDNASSLHIWTKRKKGFHRYHPHRTPVSAVTRPRPRAFDDGATSDSEGSSWAGASVLALALSARPRAPDPLALGVSLVSYRQLASTLPLAPFAPRPPPFASV